MGRRGYKRHIILLMKRMEGCNTLDYIKEFRQNEINTITEFTENHRGNWNKHVLRMSRSRIPFQILRYQLRGRRSLGRPFKRRQATRPMMWKG